ncbi:ATP-dependent zinc metalloprotease FtsH-like isoform X2 [Dreissena polymorpha]|uniref:ATP-dependent zinc metalloprotease FtsH-like isoform X2 n=1 Tax=Dreissena polymorpha TaxID=45954 RepID=UPI002264D6A6|nr:ATP-dependent zinc metalloprotease FtsH-like isoform X2 [Dreissena polymorpha]
MAYCSTLSLLRKNICVCRIFSKQHSILLLVKTKRHNVWSIGSMQKWFTIPRRTKLTAVMRQGAKQPKSDVRNNAMCFRTIGVPYQHLRIMLGIMWGTLLLYGAYEVLKTDQTSLKKNYISWDEFVELFLSKGMVLSAVICESFFPESDDNSGKNKIMKYVYIKLDPEKVKESLENGAIPRHIKTKDGQELHNIDGSNVKVQVVVRICGDESFRELLQDCQTRGVIPPGQPIQVFSMFNKLYFAYAVFLCCVLLGSGMTRQLRKKEKFELALASLKKTVEEPLKAEMFADRKQVFLKDIGGLHDAKAELQKVVNYFKNPSMNMVFQASRNILVTGTAGTGKRSLIRALASECQVPLISELQIFMHLLDFYLDLNSKEKLLFLAETKFAWPESFILYIDVDAIVRLLRDINRMTERDLNEYIESREFWLKHIGNTSHFVQLGVYNEDDTVSQKDLQKFIFSKGMFSRLIKVEMPNYEERLEIAKVCLSKYTVTPKLPDNVVKTVVQLMDGKTGEDIDSLCSQISMSKSLSPRLKLRPDDLSDFQYACERLSPGNPILPSVPEATVSNPDLNEVITCHKLGHALVAIHLKNTDFIPFFSKKNYSRIGFQGFYNHMDKRIQTCSRETLDDILCHYIAGWAAEAVMYNTSSRGGVDTLHKMKDFALQCILPQSIHEKSQDSVEHAPKTTGDQHNMLYPSQQFRDKIRDREAQQLIGKAFKQAEQILISEKKTLQEMIKKSLRMSLKEPKNLSLEDERNRFENLLSMVSHEGDHGMGIFNRGKKYEDKIIRDCGQLFVSPQKPEG